MTPVEAQFYSFVIGLVDVVMLLTPIAWPFVVLGFVIFVLRRAFVTARGERDAEYLIHELDQAYSRMGAAARSTAQHMKARIPRAD